MEFQYASIAYLIDVKRKEIRNASILRWSALFLLGVVFIITSMGVSRVATLNELSPFVTYTMMCLLVVLMLALMFVTYLILIKMENGLYQELFELNDYEASWIVTQRHLTEMGIFSLRISPRKLHVVDGYPYWFLEVEPGRFVQAEPRCYSSKHNTFLLYPLFGEPNKFMLIDVVSRLSYLAIKNPA